MSDTFKALVINQEGEKFTRAVSDLNLDLIILDELGNPAKYSFFINPPFSHMCSFCFKNT